LDLCVEAWRKKQARGDVMIVRYGDDAVLGLEPRQEADRLLASRQEAPVGNQNDIRPLPHSTNTLAKLRLKPVKLK
jgi:hypothetical protein